MRLTVSAFVVIVAGLLHAASLATPWSLQPAGWLQLLALATLIWQLDRTSRPLHAALLSWIFTTAWLSGTFWWMFVAMYQYAGLPAWLAAFAVIALAAVLAIYYGMAGAVFKALLPRNKLGAGVLFASLWLLAELARGVWFTGFGWGAAGYAHIGALAESAKFVGAYGVTALVAFVAYLLAAWIQQPFNTGRIALAGLAALVAAAMAWSPGSFTVAGATLKVALLQGNIAQDEKFQAGTGVSDSLRWYGEQLNSATAPLVVAPETAIPLLPKELPVGYWAALQQRFTTSQQAVLVGIPLGDNVAGYTNSVVGFKPRTAKQGGAVEVASYRYDKHHLVPFGEFIPPLFRWFTNMMKIPLGDFNRGAIGQASFEWQGQRLAPNVCYEDLFGEELAARFIDATSAPTIFVNLSNIGWFGNTVAIDQHLNISRMRALEFGRPFIRATNTGDTSIIDHTGKVTQSLPRYTRGVLVGEVQGRNGITPYAWWASKFGLWPLWLLACSAVALTLALRLWFGTKLPLNNGGSAP